MQVRFNLHLCIAKSEITHGAGSPAATSASPLSMLGSSPAPLLLPSAASAAAAPLVAPNVASPLLPAPAAPLAQPDSALLIAATPPCRIMALNLISCEATLVGLNGLLRNGNGTERNVAAAQEWKRFDV